jgi:hypothetical protein
VRFTFLPPLEELVNAVPESEIHSASPVQPKH